jgi:predicted SprT family Zn-dependent metalloprotease
VKYIKDIGLFEAEHINYKKIDLRAEFDHINTRQFDGKVKPVPLRWMNSKNTVGLMSYDGQNIRDIGISYYYKMSLQELRNVLAHEMIHAYLEQTGVRERDAHGPRFMRMREELNKKFPEYNIVKSENAEEFEVSSYARIKEYGVVIFDEIEAISLVVVPVDLITDNNLADFIVWLKKIRSAYF